MKDLPDFTEHEKRAMYYIKDVNQQLNQKQPANISTLAEESEWRAKYFTRARKRLQPKGLLKVEEDGRNTRLELTSEGRKVVDLLLEINEVMP